MFSLTLWKARCIKVLCSFYLSYKSVCTDSLKNFNSNKVIPVWRYFLPVFLDLWSFLWIHFTIHYLFHNFSKLIAKESKKILEIAAGRSSSQQIYLTKPCYLFRLSLYFCNVSFLWFFHCRHCFLQVIQLSCSWFLNSVMKIATGY